MSLDESQTFSLHGPQGWRFIDVYEGSPLLTGNQGRSAGPATQITSTCQPTSAKQPVGDCSAGGDQMGKAFESLDCGPLALRSDRLGKGLETEQKDRYGDQVGHQDKGEKDHSSHDG
jgi:hypothetical protein